MKILLLSNKVPYPANDGSSIAIASMIDGLIQNRAEVTLLSLNTSKHFKKEEDIYKNLPQNLRFYQEYTDNRITPAGAVINLISGKPYHVSRFRVKDLSRKLDELLAKEDFDVVQLEGLAMGVYLKQVRQVSSAKVVLRAHNVESQIWQRHISHEKNPLKRAYLKLQAKRLGRFERKMLYETDAVVSITEDDLRQFRKIRRSKKGMSLPCGVNLKKYRPCPSGEKSADVCYLASFDWLPNQQGALWFIEKVWPLIRTQDPKLRFRLGGRHMPAHIKSLKIPGVEIIPDVPDMREFMCSATIAVVPLLAGSGMRIKILENMALGLCQVSTTIGAEGIEVTDGEDIVLADDPQTMANAITGLLRDEAGIRSIGNRARQTAEKLYSNRKLGENLLDFYETEVC